MTGQMPFVPPGTIGAAMRSPMVCTNCRQWYEGLASCPVCGADLRDPERDSGPGEAPAASAPHSAPGVDPSAGRYPPPPPAPPPPGPAPTAPSPEPGAPGPGRSPAAAPTSAGGGPPVVGAYALGPAQGQEYAYTARGPGNVAAVVSLVLAIAGIAVRFAGGGDVFGLSAAGVDAALAVPVVLGALAVVLGGVGLRRSRTRAGVGKSTAIIGLVLGMLTVVVGIGYGLLAYEFSTCCCSCGF